MAYLSETSEWTFDLLERYEKEISRIAQDKFKLHTYPNQIEIITSEQMLDCYSSIGLPIGYNHWSYGKHFIQDEKRYKHGEMSLAYEIVINSSPCISYCMEENTMMMQALVIAHAAQGHNSFFCNNYLFKQWTDATGIIDYLVFAKNYIVRCEEKYGVNKVEETLDSCHALMSYGVDRYKRPKKISLEKERDRQKERESYRQSQINDLWRTIPENLTKRWPIEARFPEEPQENILYFIEKNAPLLAPWQREIIRIVRKIAQYFYPQKQTKISNEGWATLTHYNIMNELYNEGLVTDGFMLEFIKSHSGVIAQQPYYSKYYSGINPYALGFGIYRDIRRICENPTEEDKRWFPDLVGSDWLTTSQYAAYNFRDDSFISQFLSPKVIRDFKLFSVLDDDKKEKLEISAIHDDEGYRHIRQVFSDQNNLSIREPNIQVYEVDEKSRSMVLRHYSSNRRVLNDDTKEVLKHVARLWGFTVYLEVVDINSGTMLSCMECTI